MMSANGTNQPNRPHRLEIGPGEQPRQAGWVTVDCQPGPNVDRVVHWGSEPLPFEDDSFDRVLARHVLEHVPWYRTVAALREAYRVLRPAGVIELHVPDLDLLVRAVLEQRCFDDHAEAGHNRELHWMHWVAERLFHLGPERQWHRACFNHDHLCWCLDQAGFLQVTRIPQEPDNPHGVIDLEMRARKVTSDTSHAAVFRQRAGPMNLPGFQRCVHRAIIEIGATMHVYCTHPAVNAPGNQVTRSICGECEYRTEEDRWSTLAAHET